MKAVIMAGGRGTRFWPLSRARRPKQFLPIVGERTLLQQTVERLAPLMALPDVWIICGPGQRSQVLSQLPEMVRGQVVSEPAARSTAACVGLAALQMKRSGQEETMVVLPADHRIGRVEEFQRALAAAARAAEQGFLVTFGIHPERPATGYGYLSLGEIIGHEEGFPVHRVQAFVEKPDAATARRYLDEGGYFWNSGMFVWTVGSILEEMGRWMPALASALEQIEKQWEDAEAVERIYRALEPVSIDYGVMERSQRVVAIPCDLEWSDLGSWQSVALLQETDAAGVSAGKEIVNLESHDCLVHAPAGKIVTLLGVGNLLVIDTEDALLVCHAERAEEVRGAVSKLEERGLDEYV